MKQARAEPFVNNSVPGQVQATRDRNESQNENKVTEGTRSIALGGDRILLRDRRPRLERPLGVADETSYARASKPKDSNHMR